jgi:hypothetical protein
MAQEKKIPRSQRRKANKKEAKRARKIDRSTYVIYGLSFIALCYAYYVLLTDWDTTNFFLTVIISLIWMIMFVKYGLQRNK